MKDSNTNSRIKWVRRFSYLMDNSIRVPGIGYRIGLDPILGLVPVLGDLAGGVLSAYIVYQAHRIGVPRKTLARMIYNVGVETLVGAVPVVGDLFDAGWKANTRNVALLDEHLNKTKKKGDELRIRA